MNITVREKTNRYYFNTTFSLQMVVHLNSAELLASASASLSWQTLMAKPGAWWLGFNSAHALEWSVNFGTAAAPTWINATAPPEVFLPSASASSSTSSASRSWVVKATVSRDHGGVECANYADESCVPTIKVHVCELLTINGLQNRCNMTQKASASFTNAQHVQPA